MMYNFAFNAAATQLFLALSAVGTPTTAADFIGSIAKAPPPANVDRRRQQAECVCSPRAYTFKLFFEQTCDVNTIDGKPGILATDCVFTDYLTPTTDLTPVVIDSVDILELNPNGIIALKSIPNVDGDEFSYTSSSALLTPDEPLVDQEVPSRIQLNLFGKNAAGITVLNTVSWDYDLTNCDDEPIMTGYKIGLIEVVDYETAIPAFCPAIETDPPTSTPPSDPPTSTPSLSPTDPPTSTPSLSPTYPPTARPIITIPPTEKPTPEPTNPPTPSPVAGSMSYAASFSLSHMSKASKGKAHNAGKGKSGKLIRQRI
eukprot:scaffold4092_cov150-Skeletonema_menzelii.AAC.1